MAVTPNTQRLIKLLAPMEVSIATVNSTTALNATGIQTHTNASGAYVNGRNVVVKNATADASAQLLSGAIYVPAGALIRSITVLVTTSIVQSTTASLGVRAGTSVSDATYCLLDVDSLSISGAGPVAAGVGTSSDTVLQTDLTGAAALALSSLYIASAGEIHVEMQPSTGTLTTGAVSFIVEFDYLGGN